MLDDAKHGTAIGIEINGRCCCFAGCGARPTETSTPAVAPERMLRMTRLLNCWLVGWVGRVVMDDTMARWVTEEKPSSPPTGKPPAKAKFPPSRAPGRMHAGARQTAGPVDRAAPDPAPGCFPAPWPGAASRHLRLSVPAPPRLVHPHPALAAALVTWALVTTRKPSPTTKPVLTKRNRGLSVASVGADQHYVEGFTCWYGIGHAAPARTRPQPLEQEQGSPRGRSMFQFSGTDQPSLAAIAANTEAPLTSASSTPPPRPGHQTLSSVVGGRGQFIHQRPGPRPCARPWSVHPPDSACRPVPGAAAAPPLP